jgi:hypothetical protein
MAPKLKGPFGGSSSGFLIQQMIDVQDFHRSRHDENIL